MVREGDDVGDGARTGSGSGASPEAEGLLPHDERDTLRRGELVFPPEADTLTAHDLPTLTHEEPDAPDAALRRDQVRRRDTMPVPPDAPQAPVIAPPLPSRPAIFNRALSPLLPVVLRPPMPVSSAVEASLDDDDLVEDDRADDDATQASIEPFTPFTAAEDSTSPTLSLANRSASSREVYRLFLASEYAPALALANELISQGDDDPILITIARECRASLLNPNGRVGSSAPPSSAAADDVARAEPGARIFAGVHGKMTLEQLATMTGMSLDQVLKLLERFVTMGVLTVRQPR